MQRDRLYAAQATQMLRLTLQTLREQREATQRTTDRIARATQKIKAQNERMAAWLAEHADRRQRCPKCGDYLRNIGSPGCDNNHD